MHFSLFTTFPPYILVCPPNIFDKSTPLKLYILCNPKHQTLSLLCRPTVL